MKKRMMMLMMMKINSKKQKNKEIKTLNMMRIKKIMKARKKTIMEEKYAF